MSSQATVFVVDDDPGALHSARWLLESVGHAVEMYSSASAFLDNYDPARPGCLVLDVRMPGMSGVELQAKLVSQGPCPPIVFLTGHGDVSTCASALRTGAVDFIEKPASDELLLASVREALEKDSLARRAEQASPEVAEHMRLLTPREREVMRLLYDGITSKSIAAKLGISFQTVAKHRTRVLEKLNVANEAELVRVLLSSGLSPA